MATVTCTVTPNPATAGGTVTVAASGFQRKVTSAVVQEYIEQPQGGFSLERERTLTVENGAIGSQAGNVFPVPNVPSLRFDVLVSGEVVASCAVPVQA